MSTNATRVTTLAASTSKYISSRLSFPVSRFSPDGPLPRPYPQLNFGERWKFSRRSIVAWIGQPRFPQFLTGIYKDKPKYKIERRSIFRIFRIVLLFSSSFSVFLFDSLDLKRNVISVEREQMQDIYLRTNLSMLLVLFSSYCLERMDLVWSYLKECL